MDDRVDRILRYHVRTKHHLGRYAASLGYLDWATQPEPFRSFADAPTLPLPLAGDGGSPTYADLYRPGAVPPRPLDLPALGLFLGLALGLSAWKAFGAARWALRCNPSSGNLHPTEGYAVLPPLGGHPAGVWHYLSRDHLLERRCAVAPDGAAALADVLPSGGFLVGLSTIHWREAWKYGERAYRYCQHDAGHAIATVRYAAAVCGWSAHLLAEAADADVARLLGLDRDEAYAHLEAEDREHPVAALLVAPRVPATPAEALVARAARALQAGQWTGRANPLSPDHVTWDVVVDAAEAAAKPTTAEGAWDPPLRAHVPRAEVPTPAAAVLRQRRSCLALDGETAIDAATLFAMLDRLLPRPGVPPWDALPWAPKVHAVLFVHRVAGLTPGLYAFERDAAVHDAMRAATRPEFRWEPVSGAPPAVRLFLLEAGDFRRVAQAASCHQAIAADGAFSLGMLAEFGDAVRAGGPWWYRRLFWEAGVLGQVLYLEAEGAGVRGTGIGCYFDDVVHDVLGLSGDRFQDLYHFTLGGPVEDPRLATIPAYAHLPAERTVSGWPRPR